LERFVEPPLREQDICVREREHRIGAVLARSHGSDRVREHVLRGGELAVQEVRLRAAER
jgi:hypothetical protein